MIYLDVKIELLVPSAMGDVVDILYKLGAQGTDVETVKAELVSKLIEMLLLCFFTLVVGYLASRCSAIASMGFGANLRKELFFTVQDLSFENIDRLKISSLITRMTSDVSMLQNVYKNTIVTFIKGPLMLIEALRVSVTKSPELSKVFYFALPAIVIVLVVMGYVAVPMFKKMLKMTDRFNGVLRGNINGIRVVKSFVREDYAKERFQEVNENVMKMNIKAQKLVLYISPAIMFIMYGCIIFALWRGSDLIIKGTSSFTTGEMTAFVSYVTQVLSSVMTVLLVFVSMIMAKASIGRLSEVFNQKPTISDENADENAVVEDGTVEFRNVSFKYDDSAVKNVLENISLKINSGETIGIIGGTGSSKSTLIQLIPRLYEASEGEVLVGGKNVKDYKFKNLRDKVSVVMQQNILFSGTIMDNIRWGRLDATDEEVMEAAKLAMAHDFIMEFENGYNTELGQGGNTVSGGQRQRICIARAILRNAKVLIFDDSTSAVDTATDAKIRAAIRTDAFKGTTKIIIAQRITSIMDADRIVVLEGGKIAGIGTHDDLKENNDIYREIFISQQEGVLAQ